MNVNTQNISSNSETNKTPWLTPEFTDLALQETLNAGGDGGDGGAQES